MNNIVWLTPEFPSSKDNIKGIYIYRTVRELAKYYNIHVICLYPAAPPILEMIKYWRDWSKIYRAWKSNYHSIQNPDDEIKNLSIKYLHYFRLPRSRFHHIEGWFSYFYLRKYLTQIINKKTIIHANWIFPAGTLAKIISNKYKIPYLISLMGSDINRLEVGSRFWKSAKNLLENAPMVTSVTDDLFKKAISKNIDLTSARTFQIDNFYEPEKFSIKSKSDLKRKYNINFDRQIIFFAGGLIPVKNVDVLISAFKQASAKNDNLELYLAGSGSDEGKLKRLVKEFALEDKVIFLGQLLSEQLIDYYNMASVFCLPSKSEGLPNVIVESLFCGTPVVASNVGGISTIVKDRVNGYLVEPNSVKDLSDTLLECVKTDWNRESIRQSISHLNSENILKKYRTLYKSIGDQN